MLVYHLRRLIKINRQILNRLNKDEATITTLRNALDERAKHVSAMDDIVANTNKEDLSKDDITTLKALYDRFYEQWNKIQEALDYITEESQSRLEKAIKQRKAEEGYQVLK